ncbi:MAG: hypothetical protein EDM05_56710 [Leptolyngbya sp. IPPAS B-1204]|nr:hypothetical protein [Elainella sp. C42_A2020_010]RNJ66408.1 MAG: hypothetical protein EDM05_26100 [Leptolyngbya sp. IPPAS B-1204]
MTDTIDPWHQFVAALQNDILPIYARHEDEFDYPRIHGRLHICRSIVLAEVMASLYTPFAEVDRFAIRYAVAFHDSARQDNGVDIWELASAENCFNYLRRTLAIEDVWARSISQLIVKQGTPQSINQQIADDADTLEIMRLTKLAGFKPAYLHFGQNIPELGELRESLINEAWQLIDITEQIKGRLSPRTYLEDVMALAQSYPLLAAGLHHLKAVS